MAAVRKWYFARDGMGHADRSRFHDALGLDTQPWRLCFSSARRCAESNTNGVAKRYSYSRGDSYAYTDSYAYGHANRQLPGNLYDNYYHWPDNPWRHGYRQPLRRLHHG